jgi:hypothetical protein
MRETDYTRTIDFAFQRRRVYRKVAHSTRAASAPVISRRCQSPRTNLALTTGREPVASVRRRAVLELLWRLVPLELPRGEAPDVDVELVQTRIVAVARELNLELKLGFRDGLSTD